MARWRAHHTATGQQVGVSDLPAASSAAEPSSASSWKTVLIGTSGCRRRRTSALAARPNARSSSRRAVVAVVEGEGEDAVLAVEQRVVDAQVSTPARELPARRSPDVSVNRCSRFQRRPSGRRTGRLSRCTSSNHPPPPASRHHAAAGRAEVDGGSLKVEDLLEAQKPLSAARRRTPPSPTAAVVASVAAIARPPRSLGLDVADQQPVVARNKEAAPARLAQRVPHLGHTSRGAPVPLSCSGRPAAGSNALHQPTSRTRGRASRDRARPRHVADAERDVVGRPARTSARGTRRAGGRSAGGCWCCRSERLARSTRPRRPAASAALRGLGAAHDRHRPVADLN